MDDIKYKHIGLIRYFIGDFNKSKGAWMFWHPEWPLWLFYVYYTVVGLILLPLAIPVILIYLIWLNYMVWQINHCDY